MWSPFVKGWSELDEITDDLSDDAGSLEKITKISAIVCIYYPFIIIKSFFAMI